MDTTRIKLSALWAVVTLNIAFADIVGFVHPGALQNIIDGAVGFEITQELLLVFSVLIDVPIIMVFLSLVLRADANSWLSTIAVILTTMFIVAGGSATLSYFFFATVEILAMLTVAWYWWRQPSRLISTLRAWPLSDWSNSCFGGRCQSEIWREEKHFTCARRLDGGQLCNRASRLSNTTCHSS
jgi:hypothetical protein